MVNKIVLFFLSFFILVAAAPGIMAAEEAAQDDEWKFVGELYLWGAEIDGATASGADIEITLHDILEEFNIVAMGVVAARKGKWLFLTDVLYLDIEEGVKSSASVPVGPFGGSTLNLDVDAEAEMTAWVVTPAVGYTVIQNEKVRLDLLAGARYLYIKVDTQLDINAELGRRKIIASRQVSERIIEKGHGWDGIVGIRGEVNLNEKWFLPFWGDIGTGDHDLTWQALGGVGYRFNKVNVVAGYRYLKWEFEDDGALADLDISGPILGCRFLF